MTNKSIILLENTSFMTFNTIVAQSIIHFLLYAFMYNIYAHFSISYKKYKIFSLFLSKKQKNKSFNEFILVFCLFCQQKHLEELYLSLKTNLRAESVKILLFLKFKDRVSEF